MPYTQLTVSQLVRADYRLADVFKKWGINYCCGGNLMVKDICHLQGLEQAAVEAELRQAQQSAKGKPALQATDWPVDFLTDYILQVHHAYVKTTAPKLTQALEAFAGGHQKQYPYIADVYGVFKKLTATLELHMQEEEAVLFPYLKQLHHAAKNRESYGPLLVRTLHKPLVEQTSLAQKLITLRTQLREATNNFRFAETVCTNHQVLYHKLQEFETDLAQHTHLEQDVLFKKGTALENQLLQQ